jgi:hypothetical protein
LPPLSLQLSRETLRQLDPQKLAGVEGGFTESITTIFSVVVSCVNP